MKHTYYPSLEDTRKLVVWKENLKAVGLAVAIGAGMAFLLVYQLSK